ncbi:MAG TPA: hypothetical protein ENN79_00530 [Desulfobacteraceae bacterium]|nr:hypothetical protein [Desulfobacteraceae bacterium]
MLPGYIVRRCFLLPACLSVACLSGCLVIPTPEHALLEGHGKIEQVDTGFLEQRKTTREEILLRFGEPDLSTDNDRILAYHWTVVHGYWFVSGYTTAAGGPIPKDYFFVLEFDDEGLLKRFEIAGSVWKSKQDHMKKFKGSTAHPGTGRELFVIDPSPRLNLDRERPPSAGVPIHFGMGEFRSPGRDDGFANFLGHKKAAFGVIMADIRTCRPFTEIVGSAVASQLRFAGHDVVLQDADIIVTGEIADFGVATSTGFSTWDAVGTIDVTLEFRCASCPDAILTRRYQSKQVIKTMMGPSMDDFETIARACVEDLQNLMASDTVLMKLLVDGCGSVLEKVQD